jgi:hypothetical protein
MKRALAERPVTSLLQPVPITLVALAMLLAGCGDTQPLYGPETPRDGAGRPVDPIYGTSLPGTPAGNGGM